MKQTEDLFHLDVQTHPSNFSSLQTASVCDTASSLLYSVSNSIIILDVIQGRNVDCHCLLATLPLLPTHFFLSSLPIFSLPLIIFSISHRIIWQAEVLPSISIFYFYSNFIYSLDKYRVTTSRTESFENFPKGTSHKFFWILTPQRVSKRNSHTFL